MKKGLIAVIVLCVCLAVQSFAFSEMSNGEQASAYKSQDPLAESMERGSEIYTDFCMQCHLAAGEGVANTFPPLAKSDWLTPAKRRASIHAIKYGLSGEIQVNGEVYNSAMLPLGLEDDEIADVMNYILNNWGNSSEKMVTEEEVAGVQK